MANRLLLSSSGLKVSKTGFDVLTAGPENIALDTNKGLFVWYTAVYSRPAGAGVVNQDLTYPALPYTPCFTYQYQLTNLSYWQQGHTYLGVPVQQMTSSSFRIAWQAAVAFTRVTIYAIEGQS